MKIIDDVTSSSSWKIPKLRRMMKMGFFLLTISPIVFLSLLVFVNLSVATSRMSSAHNLVKKVCPNEDYDIPESCFDAMLLLRGGYMAGVVRETKRMLMENALDAFWDVRSWGLLGAASAFTGVFGVVGNFVYTKTGNVVKREKSRRTLRCAEKRVSGSSSR